MTTIELLWECFRHFVHLDESNAAMHTALVRYSPITFRLAEELDSINPNVRHNLAPAEVVTLQAVLAHRGQYEEDKGR